MRRTLSILFLALSITTAAIAKDDHDDNAPVQSGYAVVTPTGTNTNGLMAFATFGLRGRGQPQLFAQAGVLPPALTTNAMLFVDSNGRLSRYLGVAIVNPNAAAATLTLVLRNQLGNQVGTTTTLPLDAHKQVSKFVNEIVSNLSTDFTGTLSITSTAPVSIVGLRFRGQNFSTIEVANLSAAPAQVPVITTGVGGAGAILLPQFAANGGWATEIVIVNTGTAALTVRIDLFKPDGTPLTAALNQITASSFTNISVPVGGVAVYAPRNDNNDTDF